MTIIKENISSDIKYKIDALLDYLSAELYNEFKNTFTVVFNCSIETYSDLFSYRSYCPGLHNNIKDNIQLNIIPNFKHGRFDLQIPIVLEKLILNEKYKYKKINDIINQINNLSD